MRRSTGRGPVVAAVALAAAAAWPASARAWCQMTSEGSRPRPGQVSCIVDQPSDCELPGVTCLAWRQRCLSYAVDERGTSTMDQSTIEDVVARSFRTWSQVRCDGEVTEIEFTDLGPSTCLEAQHRDGGGNVHTIAFVDDWAERDYDPDAYALTTVWHSKDTGEIFDADTQLNERLGPFQDCPSGGCSGVDGRMPVDLQNVITHEAGHFLGLAHSTRDTATMAPSSDRGETAKRILDPDDLEGFCAIYPPGSLPAECDPTPRKGLDLDCEDDGGCGCTAPGHSSPARALAVLPVVALLARRARRRR